jgi:hypothetical protein
MKTPFDVDLGFAIALANAQSFNNTFFSEPLTTYAQGFRDTSDLDAELAFLCPEVQTGRRFEFRKADAKADFYTDTDDTRATGADFKRVQFSGELVQSKTYNKGLTTVIDADEVADLAMEEQMRVAMLLRRIKRSDLLRAYTAVLAAATNDAKTWNSSADPDGDLMGMLDTAGDAMGFNANRVLFGRAAWTKRFLALRASDKAGAFASSGLTPEGLAAMLGVEKVMISQGRYQSATATKAALLGAYVIGFFAADGLSREDPSHAKRFVSPCADGARYRVYRQEKSAKLIEITVEHYSNVVVTASTGLRKLTVS